MSKMRGPELACTAARMLRVEEQNGRKAIFVAVLLFSIREFSKSSTVPSIRRGRSPRKRHARWRTTKVESSFGRAWRWLSQAWKLLGDVSAMTAASASLASLGLAALWVVAAITY
jgi:hypothetical protein